MLTADHHPHGRGRAPCPGAEVPHPDRRLHVRPRRRRGAGRRAGQGGSTPVTTEAPRLADTGGEPRAPAQSRTGTAISLGAITVTVFYPPHIEFSGQPEISIYAPTGSEPSAVIHWAGGNEHITGVAQADERIGIYLQAKDMLAGHRHAVANHAGIGEYVN